jgi:hypothetical protein
MLGQPNTFVALKTDRSACEADVGANCTYTASTLDFSTSGECILCAFPRFVNAERRTCEACAAGQEPNSNRTGCTACTGNTISPFGYHCEACPATAVPIGLGRIVALCYHAFTFLY